MDHIGFEVDDLGSFCKKLDAESVKSDLPFRKIESIGLSVAFLTDPWGTYIELTRGWTSSELHRLAPAGEGR